MFTLICRICSLVCLICLTCVHAQAQTTPNINDCFEFYGWTMARQFQLKQLNLTDSEKAALKAGVQKHLQGYQYSESEVDALAFTTAELIQERISDTLQNPDNQLPSSAKDSTVPDKTFSNQSSKKNMSSQHTASGLEYEILRKGTDQYPVATSKVKVHYEGRLVDGTIFDSSYKRGEPAIFPVGGVIPGFKEGLMLVGVGGKIRLTIPAALGYGAQKAGSIPPNSVLIFDVELIEIDPKSNR